MTKVKNIRLRVKWYICNVYASIMNENKKLNEEISVMINIKPVNWMNKEKKTVKICTIYKVIINQ